MRQRSAASLTPFSPWRAASPPRDRAPQRSSVSVTRRLISSGSKFEAEIGFSRALVDGDWVFVSGTTGFDYATMTIAEGVVEQTEQCMKNIAKALTDAGVTTADVVRVRYILPRAED